MKERYAESRATEACFEQDEDAVFLGVVPAREGGEDEAMMVVFEVYLAPGADPSTLLTPQTQRDTKAQVMTLDEARKVGFGDLPDPQGKEVRLIAVAKHDASWIHRALETNEAVGDFRMYDVD